MHGCYDCLGIDERKTSISHFGWKLCGLFCAHTRMCYFSTICREEDDECGNGKIGKKESDVNFTWRKRINKWVDEMWDRRESLAWGMIWCDEWRLSSSTRPAIIRTHCEWEIEEGKSLSFDLKFHSAKEKYCRCWQTHKTFLCSRERLQDAFFCWTEWNF